MSEGNPASTYVMMLSEQERELLIKAMIEYQSKDADQLVQAMGARLLPLEFITKTITASFHALRSYQFHNSSEDWLKRLLMHASTLLASSETDYHE